MGSDALWQHHVKIRTTIKLLTTCIRKNTALLEITSRSKILHILITTCNVHVMAVLPSCLECKIVPVGIRIVVRVRSVTELLNCFIRETWSLTTTLQCLIIVVSGIGRIHPFHQGCCILNTKITWIANLWRTVLPSFCSYQNHTIRCFRTIDGCWRSIL